MTCTRQNLWHLLFGRKRTKSIFASWEALRIVYPVNCERAIGEDVSAYQVDQRSLFTRSANPSYHWRSSSTFPRYKTTFSWSFRVSSKIVSYKQGEPLIFHLMWHLQDISHLTDRRASNRVPPTLIPEKFHTVEKKLPKTPKETWVIISQQIIIRGIAADFKDIQS